MSVSYEEMEAKRQEMVASFKDIAAAMTRCVAIIEDYARLAPSTLVTSAALAAVGEGAHAAETLAAAAAGTGKKVRVKKEKKPKDPNAPKRPPSAYLLFQNDVREQIRQANPGLPYKEVLGVIANRWKELDEDARKVYEVAYNEATAAFRSADEAYKTGVPLPAAAASDSDSSDEESSSEEGTPVKGGAAAAVATPLTDKKDKKRKTKDEEPVSEKKSKKKSHKNKD